MLRTTIATLASIVILLAAGASAAVATTGPSPYTVVKVRLVDGRIVLSKLRRSAANEVVVDW